MVGRGTLSVPLELTKAENHAQLQSELEYNTQEQQVLESHVTIAKVIIASLMVIL